jgi:ABC-type Fe3+-citrate transport system substrate-binding protein
MADYNTNPTSDDVITAFSSFLEERGSAGVLLAKETAVSFTDGVVTVVFNPAAVVPDPEALLSLSPYDNLAQLAGIPVCFSNDEGEWLRRVVTAVATQLPDGTSLGSLTTPELYKIGTGKELQPGE